MPMPPSVYVGAWEHKRYVGAVVFGRGASPHLSNRFGLHPLQVVERTRVALREHEAPVSQIVARALDVLRQTSPGVRVVVSFADPYHGHHGGIYQALSWVYLGTTSPSRAYRHRASGKLLHQRVVTTSSTVRQFGRTTRAVDPSACEIVELPGKHRYAVGLDKAIARRLRREALPYPQAVEVSTVRH
jgi:hypothetical protein